MMSEIEVGDEVVSMDDPWHVYRVIAVFPGGLHLVDDDLAARGAHLSISGQFMVDRYVRVSSPPQADRSAPAE